MRDTRASWQQTGKFSRSESELRLHDEGSSKWHVQNVKPWQSDQVSASEWQRRK
jgi:hypothetical protein